MGSPSYQLSNLKDWKCYIKVKWRCYHGNENMEGIDMVTWRSGPWCDRTITPRTDHENQDFVISRHQEKIATSLFFFHQKILCYCWACTCIYSLHTNLNRISWNMNFKYITPLGVTANLLEPLLACSGDQLSNNFRPLFWYRP